MKIEWTLELDGKEIGEAHELEVPDDELAYVSDKDRKYNIVIHHIEREFDKRVSFSWR